MIPFIGLVILCFVAMLIYHFCSQGHTLTGTATVVSRRLELSKLGSKWADNYNRLITFRLNDGSELELYVSKEAYEVLADGETGQLTWQDTQFLEFETDDYGGEKL